MWPQWVIVQLEYENSSTQSFSTRPKNFAISLIKSILSLFIHWVNVECKNLNIYSVNFPCVNWTWSHIAPDLIRKTEINQFFLINKHYLYSLQQKTFYIFVTADDLILNSYFLLTPRHIYKQCSPNLNLLSFVQFHIFIFFFFSTLSTF